MKIISGLVLIKETNIGVPNLVVAAFDSEKPLHEIIIKHKSENGFDPSLMHNLGKSISSVLTDVNGRFFINTKDLNFEGNPHRPDLIMIVFAPEDIKDIKHPIPLPPERRILYISSVPRWSAGAEEAYVIRILYEQILEYNISLSEATTEEKIKNESLGKYMKDLEHYDMLTVGLNKQIQPSIVKKFKADIENKKKIKVKLKNLSAIPYHLRNDKSLLKDDKDVTRIQQTVVNQGLNKLKKNKNFVRISLSKNDLQSLGIKINEEGKYSGKVDTMTLSKKIKQLTGGVDLVRKENLPSFSVTPETLYNKYFSEKSNMSNAHKQNIAKRKTDKSQKNKGLKNN